MDGFPSTAQQAKVYFIELTNFMTFFFTVKLVIFSEVNIPGGVQYR